MEFCYGPKIMISVVWWIRSVPKGLVIEKLEEIPGDSLSILTFHKVKRREVVGNQSLINRRLVVVAIKAALHG